jgi:hypothetical protein
LNKILNAMNASPKAGASIFDNKNEGSHDKLITVENEKISGRRSSRYTHHTVSAEQGEELSRICVTFISFSKALFSSGWLSSGYSDPPGLSCHPIICIYCHGNLPGARSGAFGRFNKLKRYACVYGEVICYRMSGYIDSALCLALMSLA